MSLANYNSWLHNLLFAILIIVFTYFYTAITVNPKQMAEDMKRNSGFIPGVKPGDATTSYIDDVISKITLPGSVFLAIIAIIPAFASLVGVNTLFSRFFGGTSLIILVGVGIYAAYMSIDKAGGWDAFLQLSRDNAAR